MKKIKLHRALYLSVKPDKSIKNYYIRYKKKHTKTHKGNKRETKCNRSMAEKNVKLSTNRGKSEWGCDKNV